MRIALIAVPLMDELEGYRFPIAMDKIKTCPPYGLYLLHSIVSNAGFECELFDFICEGSLVEQRLIQIAHAFDVIGLPATSLNWPTVLDVIRILRKNRQDNIIVLGGVHPSMYWRHILSNYPVDYVIRGEADESLVGFLRYLEGRLTRDEVPGLCFKSDVSVYRNRISKPLLLLAGDMARLPLPSYDLIPVDNYEGIGIESSRGCGFSCSFCSTVSRGNWRALDPETFVERAKSLSTASIRTKTRVIQIIDDCFTLDVGRATRILELWRQELADYPITIDARADNLRDEKLLAGLHGLLNHLLVGAEAGYELGLRRVHKGITLEDLTESARLTKEYGISEACVYSFIVGFPWESYEDCIRTITFATNLKLKYDVRIYIQWFNMIPGSFLWNAEKLQGRVNIAQYDEYGFFRNERLFYAGVRLKPSEIQKINETIDSMNKLLLIVKQGDDYIETSDPMTSLDSPYAVPVFNEL